MSFIEAITSRFRKKDSPEVGILILEDHPLLKRAKYMSLVVKAEATLQAAGFATWGFHHFTAQTPEAVNMNTILGVGLVISSFISTNRNANGLSRYAADYNRSYLSRLSDS